MTAGSARASVHIEVRIECLDALDVDLGALCLVKIDVEGFEASVLGGGINAIAADQRRLAKTSASWSRDGSTGSSRGHRYRHEITRC